MVNALNQATDVRPSSQIESQVARLDNALEDLEREVQNMIAGLSDVLRSEPPSPAQVGPKVGEVLVPLASRINTITDRLYALTAGVSGARGRLEL